MAAPITTVPQGLKRRHLVVTVVRDKIVKSKRGQLVVALVAGRLLDQPGHLVEDAIASRDPGHIIVVVVELGQKLLDDPRDYERVKWDSRGTAKAALQDLLTAELGTIQATRQHWTCLLARLS